MIDFDKVLVFVGSVLQIDDALKMLCRAHVSAVLRKRLFLKLTVVWYFQSLLETGVTLYFYITDIVSKISVENELL